MGPEPSGQLGDGTTTERDSPTPVGTDTGWSAIDTGDQYTCGLRGPGTLWCWGQNRYGQLGDGTLTDRHAPVQVGTASDWTAVSAGGGHTCGNPKARDAVVLGPQLQR